MQVAKRRGMAPRSGCGRAQADSHLHRMWVDKSEFRGGADVVPVGTRGEVISLKTGTGGLVMPRRSRHRLRQLAFLNPIMRRPRADREEKRVIHGSDIRQEVRGVALTSTTPIREVLQLDCPDNVEELVIGETV